MSPQRGGLSPRNPPAATPGQSLHQVADPTAPAIPWRSPVKAPTAVVVVAMVVVVVVVVVEGVTAGMEVVATFANGFCVLACTICTCSFLEAVMHMLLSKGHLHWSCLLHRCQGGTKEKPVHSNTPLSTKAQCLSVVAYCWNQQLSPLGVYTVIGLSLAFD